MNASILLTFLTFGVATWQTLADGSGVAMWTNYYDGGSGYNFARSIAVDKGGDIFVTGYSLDADPDADVDYATVAYSNEGMPLWINRYNGPGNREDYACAVAVDGRDNVFVTGHSANNHVPPYDFDFATIAYSKLGVPLWTNRYGGSGMGNDYPYALAFDNNGNVVVVGESLGSAYDFTTIKYDGLGASLWANHYSAGKGSDYGYAVAVAMDGTVFATGGSYNGSADDFVTVAYSNAGVPLWVRLYSGPANGGDDATAIAVDGNGDVYVVGDSFGGESGYDYATIKYSSTGVPLWTNRYNGPGNGRDSPSAIAIGRTGNVLVTGWSRGINGLAEYATLAYSSTGVPLWTNRYSGPANHGGVATAMAVDNNGNVFVTGESESDYATVAYSSAGLPLWTNRYGPGYPRAITVDSSGNVFVTGESGLNYATIKYSSASCRLGIADSFKQGDSADPDVPPYFGLDSNQNDCSTAPTPDKCCNDTATGRAKTRCFGCALCSLATMLTSFKGLEATTPRSLDMQLKQANGYIGRASIAWCEIGKATGQQIGLVDSGKHNDADIDTYLIDHICGRGDGVILEMRETVDTKTSTHFILVTGRTNDGWAVFDPGWQNATPPENLLTLQGHTNGFVANGHFRKFSVAGVRTYRARSDNAGRLCVKAHSPVELLIIDPLGNRVGWDGTNDVIEIPQASYFRDFPLVSAEDPTVADDGEPTGFKTVLIPSPVYGTYTIVATGTSAGAYTLTAQTDFQLGSGQFATFSGTASSGIRVTNSFQVILPIPLNVRSIGDRVVLLSWTNAAFALQSAPSLLGPFTNVFGATSPYTNVLSGVSQFFRLISN